MGRIKKTLKIYFIVTGLGFNLFFVWMAADLPIFFDRFLQVREPPVRGHAIVCIAGGISRHNLPTAEGWDRIYTSVQLYFDGYAPIVIFTGGGVGDITEAEVYAEAAQWLGCPESAIVLCPKSDSTHQHPENVLRVEGNHMDLTAPLNIVTSSLHSKRTWMCFKRAGFENIRMVTRYTSRLGDESIVRELRTSQFEGYLPSDKKYNDIFMKVNRNISYFFKASRELAAIFYYKLKGYV